MHKNRNKTNKKGQKNSIRTINFLENDLMFKINCLESNRNPQGLAQTQKISASEFSPQFENFQIISFDKKSEINTIQKSKSILQKAKELTYSNRQQIESAKKAYKKREPENEEMFLTGCGLYKAEEQQKDDNLDFQSVNLNDALKFLVSHQKDDLQQLRTMIKKTSFDIRQYSEEIAKTTNSLQSAANLFGSQFNTDLRIKINKCKPYEKDFQNCPPQVQAKRKISISAKSITKNIN